MRGRHKAAFFLQFGFEKDNWEHLAESLRAHALMNDVATTEDTIFGTRYTVEGPIETPVGRRPSVRVIWFIEDGSEIPRFTSAYPLRRRRS